MKAQHLLLFTPVACAYTLYQNCHPPFGVHSTRSSCRSLYRSDIDSSDSSTATLDVLGLTSAISDISKKISRRIDESESTTSSSPTRITLREAEAEYGMPWKDSVDPKVEDELLYMKFWEWQMSFMEENLTDLQVVSCSNDDTDFSYNINEKKKARIVNVCATSNEYRKIRMTYYDAGDNTQVFNAVCYPNPEYNLPVLGIDLLAFNRKKYLAIVDFKPIHDEEKDHAVSYEHLLKPIKEKYDSLKGRMSSKFYDETQHFSEQMLFARFDDENIVSRDLFPAFKSYVETHLNLIHSIEPSPEDVDMVTKKTKQYDTYSAERDPATGLFAAMYGKEWAEGFVHDFLFSMSEKTDGPPPTNPFGGPSPPQQRSQGDSGTASPRSQHQGGKRP